MLCCGGGCSPGPREELVKALRGRGEGEKREGVWEWCEQVTREWA